MEFIEKDKTLHSTWKEKRKSKGERHRRQHRITATLALQAQNTMGEAGLVKRQKAHVIQREKTQIKHKGNKTTKIRSCTWISLHGLCAYPEN